MFIYGGHHLAKDSSETIKQLQLQLKILCSSLITFDLNNNEFIFEISCVTKCTYQVGCT